MKAPTKKKATFGATMQMPAFLQFEEHELNTMVNVLRDPLTTHVYMILQAGSVFKTGEFIGGYHRLMELSTPPQPERGARRAGPTYDQLRRVIADLEKLFLAKRDTTQNHAQGQLRLQLIPREKTSTSVRIDPMIQPMVSPGKNAASMRATAAWAGDSTHDSTHGIQEVNTSFNGSKDCELSTTAGGITRPPEGAQNGPHGPVGGQVEASPLMADTASAQAEKGRARAEQLRAFKAGLPPVKEQPSISKGGFRSIAEAATG